MVVDSNVEDAIWHAFRDGQYSDFIIRCDNKEWKVHRLVICPQSEYFKNACHGSFKETDDGCITLLEDEPEVVDAMLNFFYTCDFTYLIAKPWNNPLHFIMKVYAIADKYCVVSLKQKALSNFSDTFESHTQGDNQDHLIWLGEAAKMAYAKEVDSYKPFQTEVLTLALKYKQELMTEETGMGFRDVVHDSSDFLVHFAKALALKVCSQEKADSGRKGNSSGPSWYPVA